MRACSLPGKAGEPSSYSGRHKHRPSGPSTSASVVPFPQRGEPERLASVLAANRLGRPHRAPASKERKEGRKEGRKKRRSRLTARAPSIAKLARPGRLTVEAYLAYISICAGTRRTFPCPHTLADYRRGVGEAPMRSASGPSLVGAVSYIATGCRAPIFQLEVSLERVCICPCMHGLCCIAHKVLYAEVAVAQDTGVGDIRLCCGGGLLMCCRFGSDIAAGIYRMARWLNGGGACRRCGGC